MRPSESNHSEITCEADPMARYRNLLLLALAASAPFGYAACGSDETAPVQTQADASLPDAKQTNGGLDATTEDTCTEDSSTEDATTEDSGSEDASSEDASTEDAGQDADAEVIPPPVISNLAIDCSGPPVPGSCAAGGYVYPVNFNVTDATNCTATPTRMSGAGTPGSTSPVELNGDTGTTEYTTGSNGGNIIRITLDCQGNGGSDSEFTEFEIQ